MICGPVRLLGMKMIIGSSSPTYADHDDEDSADPMDATKDDIPSKATPKTKKKKKTPGQLYDYGGQRRCWYHDPLASGCGSIAIRHTSVDLINKKMSCRKSKL